MGRVVAASADGGVGFDIPFMLLLGGLMFLGSSLFWFWRWPNVTYRQLFRLEPLRNRRELGLDVRDLMYAVWWIPGLAMIAIGGAGMLLELVL